MNRNLKIISVKVFTDKDLWRFAHHTSHFPVVFLLCCDIMRETECESSEVLLHPGGWRTKILLNFTDKHWAYPHTYTHYPGRLTTVFFSELLIFYFFSPLC